MGRFKLAHGVGSYTAQNKWQVWKLKRHTEATWGADPLEQLGGFHTLQYDAGMKYQSSIGTNGSVGWSACTAHADKITSNRTDLKFVVNYPNIDWNFLQSIYGWAALQYQAWARGEIAIISETVQTIVLYTDYILEFWIDDELYFGGDLYAYRRAPLILRLDPGLHRIDLRLIRDVRAMGGIGEPDIQVQIGAHVSAGGLVLSEEALLLPDIVSGKLASRLGSVPIRNEDTEWIEVVGIESLNVCTLKYLDKQKVC